MDSNLNKYLAEVFRNEVRKAYQPASFKESLQYSTMLNDHNAQQFLVDNTYSLRFDEII
jgi:hypothetical protein